jgi:hypothetical protein
MDIQADWHLIQKIFDAGIKSSKHCAIASVDRHGAPHVTPIGFIFLRDDRTAFYFEQYTRALPDNFAHNKAVCLMVVNSGLRFWFQSLLVGKFSSHPGVRLHGEVGDARPARPAELATLQERIGGARSLKGSKLIWSGLQTVRDIRITGVSAVRYPRMMAHLK